MASITSTGIASGLDVESIVTQLMEVERLPIESLEAKQASYEAKISAYGTIKSTLSDFQTSLLSLSSASKFKTNEVTVSNQDVASASAASFATPGAYSLRVDSLAQAQKLVASGQTSITDDIGNGVITIEFGAISGGTFDEDAGTYSGATFTSNGSEALSITINESNSSLAGIRDAINNAEVGVTASIVNDGSDTPYRLVLTSNESGLENSIRISVADDEGSTALSSLLAHDPSGTQSLTETVTAQNAEFEVDGLAITKSSNTVTDVISGVTLNLKSTSENATTITISRDTESVATSIDAFVSSYNTVILALKEATAYDTSTGTSQVLNGESTIRTIETQIRNILNTPITGTRGDYTTLSQIGIAFQKDGTLSLDGATLKSALESNSDDVAALFASVGSTNDSLVHYASSGSNTQVGTYGITVTRLATQGRVTGSEAAGLTITAGVNDTLTVLLNGTQSTVTLSEGEYADSGALATEIQSRINANSDFSDKGITVNVTESGGVLSITSIAYGSESSANIVGGNGRVDLGLGDDASVTNGLDVAGTINGVTARGVGQALIGAAGNAAEGLSVSISGGALGSRGTVSYTQGFAYKLDNLLDAIVGEGGSIETRTDGLTSNIERMDSDVERLENRMDIIEARYRSQFITLELLISEMNSTSSYLEQQLEALANLNSQS